MKIDINSTNMFPTYYTSTDNNNMLEDDNIFKNIQNINPILLIVIFIIIIIYYAIFSSLGVNNSVEMDYEPSNKSGVYLELLLWGLFVVLLLLNGLEYFFNINIIASVKNLFSNKPEVDIIVDKNTTNNIKEFKLKEQVFHIPDNKYTYNDAKAICKAFDSRLANYKDIESAYKNGADWCSYGWSEEQMAYFPTQYDKWEKLQKLKNHKNDCGRPGINGGYIENPNVRFGVNCFGYKPKMTNDEMENLFETPIYPKTQEEINFENKVNYWKNKISNIKIAPFNNNNWSYF